jgi:hypothetical protein
MTRTKTTRKILYVGRDGIGGGLSSENPIVVSRNQMVIADNVKVGTIISRKKRGGQEKFHTSTFEGTPSYPSYSDPVLTPTQAIRGLLEYWRTASVGGVPTSDVFLHQGAKVWSVDDRNTPAVDRTGALTLNSDGIPSYQVFNGSLYFCSTNTADGYNKWNGASAVSVPATAPPDGVGKYLTEHLGRMIMAGNINFPYRVYFSSALAPENWSTVAPSDATSLDLVDDGDPEGITGIASFQNRLYVWTRTSLFEITGTTPSTFIVQRVTNGIGCIGMASIAQIPNDVVFCSDRGVHSLRQLNSGRQTESQFLSRDIQKLWVEQLNTALYPRVMSGFNPTTNNLIIVVPQSGQTQKSDLLTYNIEFGTWTKWPNINARSIAKTLFFISNKKEVLLGLETGRIGLIDRPTISDFGAGYTFKFDTGILYPDGDPSVEHVFKSITVLASTTKPGAFNVGYNVDGLKSDSIAVELTAGEDLLGTTFVLGSSQLGVTQYIPKSVPIDEVGYGIQIEITATGTSDLEVYGFILEVEDANPNYG